MFKAHGAPQKQQEAQGSTRSLIGSTVFCTAFSVGRGLEQSLSSAAFGYAFPLAWPSSPVAIAGAHLQSKALVFESVSCLGKRK